tara:strand:+ start:373 stop:783 length:411 start_codon:yes stop_codon:yes gene_type:complete
MKFKTLSGSTRRVSKIKKHLIDWDSTSRSKFQFNVKKFLEPYWSRHVVFEEFPIVGTKMSLDFFNANKKVAIEVQGGQHTKYVPYFHGGHKVNYLSQLERDHKKLKFCEINDITLVEIYEKDVLNENLFEKYGVLL